MGRQCTVDCLLNNVPATVLWDTGAQVSILNTDWVDKNLPHTLLRPISQLLDCNEDLDLRAANGTQIPFDGWMEVELKLTSPKACTEKITFPALVTKSSLHHPIIGYNVIEEMIKRSGSEAVSNILGGAVRNLGHQQADKLVHLIQMNESDELCSVTSGRKDRVVPRRSNVGIQCHARAGPVERKMTVLFEPDVQSQWPEGLQVDESVVTLSPGNSCPVTIRVINRMDHTLVLKRRTLLGQLQLVRSVMPMSPSTLAEWSTPQSSHTTKVNAVGISTSCQDKWIPPVDLSHLPPPQRAEVKTLLREESAAFARDGEDLGCIEHLQMTIQLEDQQPVQKTYTSVPRPLYQEVKTYLSDLITRGWITKSKSSYSSPVVCVRKKDGTRRLCVDYRELNRKTVPDRQPIPRIRDVLDSLGGNTWFSTLDQGKAYHQGFMSQ